MKNQETKKYQATKVIKAYNYVVTGVGDTKAEAKADLKAKLKAIQIPGTEAPGYLGQKYRPPMKVAGYVSSPGFVQSQDENGRVSYVYNEDRKAQVFTVAHSSTFLVESAKVEQEVK